MKDDQKIEQNARYILEAAKKNQYYRDDPEKQIDGLASMVGGLLEKNEDNQNEELIAFFHYVGKSLKELIEYRKLNSRNNGKS